MVCLGFKPGLQDGRRRRNHGAMAATDSSIIFTFVNKSAGFTTKYN